MQGYKIRETAKTIEINYNTKEDIINILNLSLILNKNANAQDEIKVLDMAKRWGILSSIRKVSDFRTLQSSDIDMPNIIEDYINQEMNILSDAQFFDNQNDLKNLFNEYQQYYGTYIYANKGNAGEVKFSSSDFSNQFYNRKMSDPEKYANFMYLSNQLSHIFMRLQKQKDNKGITLGDSKVISNACMSIKDYCIHKLIECKKNGADIEISLDKTSSTQKIDSVISFALPHYFEPFRVHLKKSDLIDIEIQQCQDDDRFTKNDLKTTFPLFISDEKEKLLKQLYDVHLKNVKTDIPFAETYNKENNRALRLQWFVETSEILKNKEKIKNNTKVLNEKINKNKIIEAKEKFKIKKYSNIDRKKYTKSLDFQQEVVENQKSEMKDFLDEDRIQLIDTIKSINNQINVLNSKLSKITNFDINKDQQVHDIDERINQLENGNFEIEGKYNEGER